MSQNTYEAAISHPIFIEVFDDLLRNLFLSSRNQNSLIDIPINKIKKATWLASIAALGEGDKEKNLASAYGALLYLSDTENEVYTKACYVMQSRTGNIISSTHLPKIFNNKKYQRDFGSLLNMELAGNRAELEQKFSDDSEIYFTKFQSTLWSSLKSGNNIAISAPTSSGKSYIIKKYIYELINTNLRDVIYIVPTKALINQVSNDLNLMVKDKAHVFTTYKESDELKPTIYVLTPERTLKLLQDNEFLSPSLVFMDEIHNLEDSSRGAVFENVLYRMTDKWEKAQFVVAGPFIDGLAKSISNISNIDLIDHKTFSSPVFQLKVSITFSPKAKTALYKIVSITGNILNGDLKFRNSLYSKAKSNKGDALAAIMELFDPDDQNIIYAPTKKEAESWAQKIAPVIGSLNPDIVNGADQKIKDLIEFLEDEVHPKYSLIRALRLGVAFHHSGLPDIARLEIEELYSQACIKNIVCTSTLVQGVNLPADRLIIINPKVNTQEMSNFEFFNLIGRAGRANTKLYGEVYCIDIVENEWGEDRFLTEVDKTVSSVTVKSINNNKEIISDVVSLSKSDIKENYDNDILYQLASYLRSLYNVDKKQLEKYISSSDLSIDLKEKLNIELETVSKNLSIPNELISKNPFIDPILQDEFYKRVLNDGVDNWLINRKPFDKGGENSKLVSFKEKSYYYQFWSVMERLNEIFDFESEINFKSYEDYINVGLIVKDSHQWMLGKRHKYFIENKIGLESFDESKIDKTARYVTNHISRNITFIAVKYLMLWSDVISSFLSEEDEEKKSYILNLPTMLELGSYDPVILELMNLGINRSIAIKIKPLLKFQEDMSIEETLARFDKNKMPALFKRYLKRAGF
ncbi:DEAD/DEAH box helicase [Acinetobacter sp. 22512]|uniref:DEAD/DEAH box helicase n=1 Tax=unclassified Acinetobacter TaxID=196816 RepID=UPI003F854A4D